MDTIIKRVETGLPGVSSSAVILPPEPAFAMVNASAQAQSLTASTTNYLQGSQLRIPPARKVTPGVQFRWRFSMTKTAAGTATSSIDVRVGAGVAGDTARLSFTKPAGTAAADEAQVEIVATVREGGASGVLVGQLKLVHNLASTGHATVPCVVLTAVSSAFDLTPEDLVFGVSVTPGASDAITVELVQAELAAAFLPPA